MDYQNFSGSPQPIQVQGKQYKEMLPRIQQLKSNKNSEEQIGQGQPKGPGIFFDMQKGLQYKKIETTKKIMQRASSQNQIRSNQHQQTIQATATAAIMSAGGLVHMGDKNPLKLYSPYEYLHYATKINFSKESYLNALQQLGYTNVTNLNEKPYNDIMNKTQEIIAKSYSLKYLGVIDGNMGILSKRVKLSDVQTESSPKQGQQGQNKKVKKNQRKNRNSQNNLPANISVVPTNYRPDLYNSYLITQYSLPKYLKPIIKDKDSSIVEEKQRLEKWHAEQLRKNSHFLQNDTINNSQDITQQNGTNLSASMSMNAGISTYMGKIKPKRIVQRQPSPNQQKNESVNRFYAEVPEESLCYAIIDKSNEAPVNQSYSRLINTISKGNSEQTINLREDLQIVPQVFKTAKNYYNNSEQQQQLVQQPQNNNLRSSTIYNSSSSIKFTQNQQLQDRFDHISKYLNQKKKI